LPPECPPPPPPPAPRDIDAPPKDGDADREEPIEGPPIDRDPICGLEALGDSILGLIEADPA